MKVRQTAPKLSARKKRDRTPAGVIRADSDVADSMR